MQQQVMAQQVNSITPRAPAPPPPPQPASLLVPASAADVVGAANMATRSRGILSRSAAEDIEKSSDEHLLDTPVRGIRAGALLARDASNKSIPEQLDDYYICSRSHYTTEKSTFLSHVEKGRP